MAWPITISFCQCAGRIPIKNAVCKAENLEISEEVEIRFNLGKLSS